MAAHPERKLEDSLTPCDDQPLKPSTDHKQREKKMANGTGAVVPGGVRGGEGLTFTIDPAGVSPPILRPVLEYWDRKRGMRVMPRRGDIEPLELKPYLRHLFLIEPLPGEEFRYRLIGSEITERHGCNSTGKRIREIYADIPAIAHWFTTMLLAVTTRQRPVLATGTLSAIGKDHVLSEALHLPLSDDGVTVTMIFGATRYSVPALAGGAAISAS
jgi:hypothetical protein